MSPFLQFRLWMRRAPVAERLFAVGLIAGLFALLAWALVPVSSSSSVGAGSGSGLAAGSGSGSGSGGSGGAAAAQTSTSAAGVAAGGPASSTGGSGAAGSSGSGSGSLAGPGSGAGAGGLGIANPSACGPMTSTDQGVTASEIHIDVDVANLAGQAGNSLAGIPSAQEEEAMFAAAIDAANLGGGIRCRKIVAKYYEVNALDQSSLEAACLQMVADKPFALLDEGLASPFGSPTPRDCPPSHHLPEFASLNVGQAEIHQFAPYMFGDGPTSEEVVHDWILAANQLGWFRGATKLGLLEQDCIPGINKLALADLASIGFPSSKVSTFDFGCPNAIPPPNEVQQAVVQFKTAGVTHVLDDGGVYENWFSKTARLQDYKPHYSVGDQGTIALWDNPNLGPDPDNFSGALAITSTQYGAENTAGSVFNQQTAACDKAMTAHGLPPAERSPDGVGGVACTLVAMLVTGADRSPALTRAALSSGLQSAAHLELPFPIGPANLAASHGLYGGGYWRADTWVTGCKCFKVSTPVFSPSFP